MATSKMRPQRHRLFVYGTLLVEHYNEFARAISQNGRFIGEGKIQAKLFDVGEYPGAVPSKEENDVVEGAVWEVGGDMLLTLDTYEECSDEFPQPTLFIRKKTQVLLKGQTISAWVYFYNLPTKGLKLIKSGNYKGYFHGIAIK